MKLIKVIIVVCVIAILATYNRIVTESNLLIHPLIINIILLSSVFTICKFQKFTKNSILTLLGITIIFSSIYSYTDYQRITNLDKTNCENKYFMIDANVGLLSLVPSQRILFYNEIQKNIIFKPVFILKNQEYVTNQNYKENFLINSDFDNFKSCLPAKYKPYFCDNQFAFIYDVSQEYYCDKGNVLTRYKSQI